MDRNEPHLRPVPDVEVIDAPPAVQMIDTAAAAAAAAAPVPRAPAAVIGLGNMPDPVGAGVSPALTTHLLAVGGTGVTGAGVGFLASGSLWGAGIGAASQLALLGFSGAVFGAGRMPTMTRALYGALGLGSVLGAGYLVWRR